MAGVLCHLACTEESAPQVLPLRVHTLTSQSTSKSPGCDLPSELSRTALELQALGDFAASNDSAEFLRLDQPGTALKFPVATQAAVARVDDGSLAFTGYGERRENGLDLLLWPELSSCEVWRRDGTHGYPGRHGGQALGYSRKSGSSPPAAIMTPLFRE